MENTAKIVREIRAVFGESQAQFAQRIGASQPMVARWETNQRPKVDWIGKLRKIASEAGMQEHAAELEGVLERSRVRPKIDLRDEEETEEVNAVLAILRNKELYKTELAKLRELTAKPKKRNAEILAGAQAAIDVRKAVIRLRDRGHGNGEIAEILGVPEEAVNWFLAVYDAKEILDAANNDAPENRGRK